MINLFYQYESKTFLDFINDDIKNKDEPDENVSLIFITENEDIYCPIICKSSDLFSEVVKLFYNNYPELEKPRNYFKYNGSLINIAKTIEKNKISNKSIITIYIKE